MQKQKQKLQEMTNVSISWLCYDDDDDEKRKEKNE